MKKRLKIGYPYSAILFITVLIPCLTSAQEKKKTVRLEQITVTAPGEMVQHCHSYAVYLYG
jgi:hypothetical protein